MRALVLATFAATFCAFDCMLLRRTTTPAPQRDYEPAGGRSAGRRRLTRCRR